MTSWQRALFALAAGLGLALGVACELVVGLDELSDRKCGFDEKRCDDDCVPRSNAATGCSALQCAPCVLPHATARCDGNGACAVSTCNQGYEDCDDREPGCETDLAHDPNHCGGCNNPPCRTENGTPGCSAGVCATGGCDPGWLDCNHWTFDGCETDIRTTSDCGACEIACPSGTACVAGQCR